VIKELIWEMLDVEDDTYAVYDALAEKFFEETRDSGNWTEMLPGLIDIQSVYFFKGAAYRNLQLHSLKNPSSYWYSFEFKGKYSFFATLFPYPPPPIPGGRSRPAIYDMTPNIGILNSLIILCFRNCSRG